jgi:hypothetical protein
VDREVERVLLPVGSAWSAAIPIDCSWRRAIVIPERRVFVIEMRQKGVRDGRNLPSRVCVQVVLLWLALLTEIVFRYHGVLHDSHAAAVLPYTTCVTCDEQAARVFSLCIAVLEQLVERRTRIFLTAADASGYILVPSELVLGRVLGSCAVLGRL